MCKQISREMGKQHHLLHFFITTDVHETLIDLYYCLSIQLSLYAAIYVNGASAQFNASFPNQTHRLHHLYCINGQAHNTTTVNGKVTEMNYRTTNTSPTHAIRKSVSQTYCSHAFRPKYKTTDSVLKTATNCCILYQYKRSSYEYLIVADMSIK